MRKFAGWLAIVAMALQALWPLIAHAKPANLVPVFTVGGETHYVEIPGKPSPADKHCELCFMGAVLPGADSVAAFDSFAFASPNAKFVSRQGFLLIDADARATPVLPMVMHSNHSRRTESQKAFALRAARPDVGGGFVRLGVLHG